jgi:hypothetical protein
MLRPSTTNLTGPRPPLPKRDRKVIAALLLVALGTVGGWFALAFDIVAGKGARVEREHFVGAAGAGTARGCATTGAR